MHLKADQHREWLEAILSDDKSAVEGILGKIKPDQKDKYLNGYFEFAKSKLPIKKCPCGTDNTEAFIFSHCWLMAVAFGSASVVESLISHGCNVLTTDENGRNALHCLVYIAFMRKDCENEMMAILELIEKSIPPSTMKCLLLQENQDGLRPLEYSLQLGVSSVALRILSSPSVYRTRKQHHGTSVTWWFDVTDYEKDSQRMFRSPSHFTLLVRLGQYRR